MEIEWQKKKKLYSIKLNYYCKYFGVEKKNRVFTLDFISYSMRLHVLICTLNQRAPVRHTRGSAIERLRNTIFIGLSVSVLTNLKIK